MTVNVCIQTARTPYHSEYSYINSTDSKPQFNVYITTVRTLNDSECPHMNSTDTDHSEH